MTETSAVSQLCWGEIEDILKSSPFYQDLRMVMFLIKLGVVTKCETCGLSVLGFLSEGAITWVAKTINGGLTRRS